jgi:thiol-disulfide isomerase/thioredoxin
MQPFARYLLVIELITTSIGIPYVLNVELASNTFGCEPGDAVQPTDEELYGKFAIGPKTETPLDQAVDDLNKKLAKYSKNVDLPASQSEEISPLTAEEVVKVFRAWDRKTHPVSDRTFRSFSQIVKTKTLPRHSVLELGDRWIEGEALDQHVLQIKLTAMTEKDRGDEFLIREETIDQRKAWPNQPGFRWILRPQERTSARGWLGRADNDIQVAIEQGDPTNLVITINRSHDVLGARVVAFDEDERRFTLGGRVTGAYEKFITEEFRLDHTGLAPGKVKLLGVEVVTHDDLNGMAKTARNRPQAQGTDELPLPEVGKPFAFSLYVSNKRIDSRELLGKVVLLDLWASTCAPCLKKMPELKEQYVRWHENGFEVVGVSFDDDADLAQSVVDRMQIPWPSAVVPRGSTARKLWASGGRITRLPTMLLVDRKGILRFELFSDSGNLEDKIAALLREQ